MKKYNDYNLTDEEWEEVFVCPKEFKPGDIVEAPSALRKEHGVVCKILHKAGNFGEDIFYKVESLKTGQTGKASSSLISPIGTFIDDKEIRST